jgi:hypothetical protein
LGLEFDVKFCSVLFWTLISFFLVGGHFPSVLYLVGRGVFISVYFGFWFCFLGVFILGEILINASSVHKCTHFLQTLEK